MKLTAIIFTCLYLQVSTSFLDDFRNAIFNVERGVGKLLTDVVTDVKDTIHCTISAVEQVLASNGLLDKSSSYSYRCRDLSKPIQLKLATPSKIRDQRSVFEHSNRLKYPNHKLEDRNSPKHISMEFGKSIAKVNKTINAILSHHEVNNNLKIVSKAMKEETNRLNEISKILKRELENISSNMIQEIRKLHFDRHEPNVESVLDEIKALHDIQKSSKNSTEVNEIRNVLNKVVDKLHLNSGDNNVSGIYNLKEIRKKLQRISDSDDNHIGKDSDIGSIIQDLSLKKSETTPMTFKEVAETLSKTKKNMNPSNQSTTENSLFNLELDPFNYFTPFTKTITNNKKAINDAKKIIEDSQRADQILNTFFKEHRSGYNIFSDPN